jgi:hypothetical protein
MGNELADMRERVADAESDRDVARAERDELVEQLHTLRLAHAALCSAHAELEIKHARQKDVNATQCADLLLLQREATKTRLAGSAQEARTEARGAELVRLRAEIAEANRRLETADACVAAVRAAGIDPATLGDSGSEIASATLDVLRDQLVASAAGRSGGGDSGGRDGRQSAGAAGAAGPAVVGMLLGNWDKGAELASAHPEVGDLVGKLLFGGDVSATALSTALGVAGVDPALAHRIQVRYAVAVGVGGA